MSKKVSVWMITYNHEKYLEKAIGGVLAQKVDFDWEIVICDDASTDRTQQIIKKYTKKYPKIIKAFLHKKNIGMMQNMRFATEKCTGEYIATCEGDDFWTDRRKLKKQVAFLDNHKDYSMVGHNVWILNQTTKEKKLIWRKKIKPDFTLEDTMKYGCGAPTCSLMFRKSSVANLPAWFDKCRSGDWPFHILCLKNGKMFREMKPMAVYRKHTTGSLFAASKKEMNNGNKNILGIQYQYTLETLNHMDRVFKKKYSKLLDCQRVYAYLKLAELNLLVHNFDLARNFLIKTLNRPKFLVENIINNGMSYLFCLLLPTKILRLIALVKEGLRHES